jgi:hypothetical protein
MSSLNAVRKVEMSEFTGKAGTIYVEKSGGSRTTSYDVWFEDFYILGKGSPDVEALQDAKRHAQDIVRLIDNSIIRTLNSEVADALDRLEIVTPVTTSTTTSEIGG